MVPRRPRESNRALDAATPHGTGATYGGPCGQPGGRQGTRPHLDIRIQIPVAIAACTFELSEKIGIMHAQQILVGRRLHRNGLKLPQQATLF
jgi:hypothetical protein